MTFLGEILCGEYQQKGWSSNQKLKHTQMIPYKVEKFQLMSSVYFRKLKLLEENKINHGALCELMSFSGTEFILYFKSHVRWKSSEMKG